MDLGGGSGVDKRADEPWWGTKDRPREAGGVGIFVQVRQWNIFYLTTCHPNHSNVETYSMRTFAHVLLMLGSGLFLVQ